MIKRNIQEFKPVFYMNRNSMDLCIEILDISYENENYIELNIRWWNLGYTGQPWCLDPKPTTIHIKEQDLHKWLDISDKVFVPRKEPGLPK